MKHPSIRRLSVTAAAVVTLVLAGCSGDSDGGGGESGSSGGGGGEESTQVVNDAGVEDIDLDDAVATQTVKNPGSDIEIELRVFPLEVEGKVQTLRIAVTPKFEGGDTVSLYRIFGQTPYSPQLVDRDNLKVYSVIRELSDSWAIDEVKTDAASGETIIAWSQHAAPEDDVDSFDVLVKDGWPAFTDVPVKR